MFNLGGRVVLSAGAMQELAWASRRGIVRAGGNVVIWGRRAEKNGEAAKALAEFGGRVLTQVVDVSDEMRVVDAMAEAVEEMGRLDGVIERRRHAQRGQFRRHVVRGSHSLLAINQHGAFYTARRRPAHETPPRRRRPRRFVARACRP